MKLFKTHTHLSEKEQNKGFRMYVLDGACSTGMATLQGGVYLTAFALALGASQKQIGFIASVAFLSQLMQIPGLMLVSKFPKRKFITMLAATSSRLFWLPVIVLPLFMELSVSTLLLLLFISAMIGAIPGPAWNSMLRDLLPEHKMGAINGRRLALSTIIALILTISGGYFIDFWKVKMPDNELDGFSILFGLGLIFGLLGILTIGQIPEPQSISRKVPLRQLLSTPFKDKNFRSLLAFLSFWNFAVNMSGPFFLVYLMNRIGLSLFMITILVVVSQLSNILFLKIWGRLADKLSNKSILSVSGPLFLIVFLLWTFAAQPDPHRFTLPLLFIIHFISGIAVSGVSIGTGNIALKLSPKDQAHGYMTVVGLTTSVLGALAPIAGGFLADYFMRVQLEIPLILSLDSTAFKLPIIQFRGLEFLFLISFVVGLFAMHRLALVKEVGEVGKRKVIDELTESIVLPLRSMAVVEGIQRIAIMPLSGILNRAEKASNRKKEDDSQELPEIR